MNIKEVFIHNHDNIFENIFGSSIDEYGDKYSDVYKYELERLCNEFEAFVLVGKKYNFELYDNSMYSFLAKELDDTFHKIDPTGCYLLAHDLVHQLRENNIIK